MKINRRNCRYRINIETFRMSRKFHTIRSIITCNMSDNSHLSFYDRHNAFKRNFTFFLTLIDTFTRRTAYIHAFYTFI